jgi:PAS domain S-box-containing protein
VWIGVLVQDKISRIKVLLKAHPKGLTITDISSKLKLNRNSTAKYLEILLISGLVESKSYGTARVFFLTHRLPISALVSITSDLVVTLDENHRIISVNEGFCNLFAIKKEDASGSHIVDIFKTGIGSTILPGVFSDVIADQEKVQEVRLPRDTGDLFFKIKSMKTVFDDGSRGITIIMEDVTREKKYQMELEAKEARYRGIVEDQTEFIIRFLPEGTLSFVNPSYSHFLKKKPEELLGTTFTDLFHSKDRALFDQCLHTLSRENPVTSFECRFALPRHQLRWIAWTLRAMYNSETNPIEYQAVGYDITEKKEASEKIHQSITQMEFFSKKLQDFIELPPNGNIYKAICAGLSEIHPDASIFVCSYNPETIAVTIRASFPEKDHNLISRNIGRDLIGVKIRIGDITPPEEFMSGKVYTIQRDLYNLIFQQIPENVCKEIMDTLNMGEFYLVGLVWKKTLLGNIIIALPKGYYLKDESLIEAYTKAASISLKRSIAEDALRESETLCRTVIENIDDVFYRADTEGNLVMASPGWANLLGYASPDECKGRNIARDFYREPDKRKDFLAAIAAKGSVKNYEIVLKKKDGTPIYLWTNSYIHYGQDGSVLGIEGVLHDISERKAAEKKIQQYIGEMEFLSQKLLDFMLMEPAENIYEKITSDLKNLVPDSMIVVNSINPQTGSVKVQSIVMNERQRDAIKRALGKELVGCEFLIDDAARAAFRTGRLTEANLPIFDIFFKTVPKPICDQLESELDIGNLFAIGFVRGEEILGNATIFLGPEGKIPDLPLVEMYAREAAIALQRLAAEEARRKSDEIFYNIAQNSPLPIALIEPDGTYRYINDSFTRLFGYDLNDFHTGREWFHLAFPDPVYRKQAVEVWKLDRDQYPKGYPFARTFAVQCKDSTIKEVIFRPVTLSDGILCIVYEDITERNKAEQTHRLLSSIIESTSDAVIAKDKAGMVLSWNKAAELLYGYSEQEISGKNISLIVPEDKKEEMVQIFSSIERGESISNLETRRMRKDGRIIDISMTISPITDDNGTVVGASTIARDITSRKAEEHLRESEERYRALVENISVGIYRSTGDPTGRFIWGNSSLVQILGYPSIEKLMEVGISELFVERDGRKKLLDDLKKEGFVKNREIALRRGDGKTVWVLVTALAKFDKTGNLSCINGVVEDISGQKEAEHRVQIVDKQMQDVLACIPDPVVIVDRENAVIAWNSAMVQLTGVQKTGVIGRNDYDQLFPFHNPTRPPLSTFFDAPDDELERHYPGAYRDGTVITAQVRDLTKQDDPSVIFTIRASPLCDLQGLRTGAVLIIQPVMPNGRQRTSSPPFDSVSSGMR